eukprot:CAMPEP_0172154252 /NCGR_PEP_ID=MMETSP1050-20130122/1925_1 /TAXON_ID=233186 /ORGANISM="Cryptomonas curvata, Strain CCAP979/52" /LENGTH=64 /DNA_ID=CAMNT_0012822935 /DNA_START=46 /DNA_END=240 /DNA_ORIENTATION=-
MTLNGFFGCGFRKPIVLDLSSRSGCPGGNEGDVAGRNLWKVLEHRKQQSSDKEMRLLPRLLQAK